MKYARVRSDNNGCRMGLCQTDDGSILLTLYGRSEFCISASAGQFKGEKLDQILTKFSELIDLLKKE